MSGNQELLSELIDPLIDQQTSYDQELLSELIVTPIEKHRNLIDQQNVCNREVLPELTQSLRG